MQIVETRNWFTFREEISDIYGIISETLNTNSQVV